MAEPDNTGWGPVVADAPQAEQQPTDSGWGQPIDTGTVASTTPAQEMPGITTALMHGLGTSLRHAMAAPSALAGEKQPQETPPPEAAPLEWSDIYSPVGKLLPKLAYGLGESGTSLAGGLAGGALGEAIIPGGAIPGGIVGAGMGAALQSVSPYFGEELRKSPQDPDGAWTRAIERAGASGAFASLGWGLFPAKLAEGPVKQLAFQALGIQPSVAAGEQAVQNIIQDRPVTENLGQAYATGAAGTLIPAIGHAVLGRTIGARTQEDGTKSLSTISDTLMNGVVGDALRDVQMKLTPMAARDATDTARAIAKDFANQKRVNAANRAADDQFLVDNFTPEEQAKMWTAADEEGVALQQGLPTEGIGLSTLTPEQRNTVDMLQGKSSQVWQQAIDVGLVKGEGLPSFVPRTFINAAESLGPPSLTAIGRNLRTFTPQMFRRKYLTAEETEAAGKAVLGSEAELARNIRTLPLATAKMQDAIAGRTLINKIKEVGKATGDQTVNEGGVPEGSPYKWFTVDHPAFKVSRPRFTTDEFGKVVPVKDENGNIIFDKTPLYVRSDFEGPLRAVLSKDQGAIYRGLMDLKGKTMSVIMYSPLIHNAVEYGRALPAMPGKVLSFKVYFEGNRAKKDPATMQEAIQGGLTPIGRRGYLQDITSMMEEPNLAPGRSWTSQIVGAIPGMFSRGAENATKRAIDRMGDIWHNTLLWDRVADLQMGLYVNFRDHMIAKGIDPQSASRAAAHLANRYAGSLPLESMSESSRKFANLALFSRTFTLGNIGAMKDMFVGLPKDVQAQIARDAGPEALGKVKSYAQRKAIATVMLDVGLMYMANSILQDAIQSMLGQKDLGSAANDYLTRASELLKKTREHPFDVLAHPLASIESLTSTGQNEPGKEDRILVGYQPDGTAIYARSPTGKIGEEMKGYMTGPFDMVKRKLGTIARPLWQLASNDEGFGRKVYNPNAKTTGEMLQNIGNIVTLFLGSQFPIDSLRAIRDLYEGVGDAKTNAFKLLGPLAGLTFSKGAPGGPGMGELFAAQQRHQYDVQQAMPEIRRQIQLGNTSYAVNAMTQLGIPRRLQNYYIETTISPARRMSSKKLRDFLGYATEEEKKRFEKSQKTQPTAESGWGPPQ